MIAPQKAGLALAAVTALGLAAPAAHSQTLVDRYTFTNNFSNTVIDFVGGQNGTLANGATQDNGLITAGGGLGTLGAAPSANLGSSYTLPTGAFSVEDFFTPAANATQAAFATLFSFSSSQGVFIIGDENTYNNGIANIDVDAGPADTNRVVPVATIPTVIGGLNDFVATFDGTTENVYLNGKLSGTIANTFLSPGATGPFNGIAGNSPFPDGGFAGVTNEFRIFSGALTASQVAVLDACGPNLPCRLPPPMPEASSFALLALGLLPVALLARRRRAR